MKVFGEQGPTVFGKCGIKATVLKASISKITGAVMVTFEIEYPRIVLAELNTHKMLSKNSFSSRAVPFLKMLEQLNGRPVRFGANQSGMQDKGEDHNELVLYPEMDAEGDFDHYGEYTVEAAWESAKQEAISWAHALYKSNYHKQVYNRLLEPWQMMKTVISATDWENFFWLRDHDAADPTLAELARVMREAYDNCEVDVLDAGEWHLPYIDTWRRMDGTFCYGIYDEGEHEGDGGLIPLTLDDAIKVSCARCAAVSYRNEGYGVEKSKEVYERLVGDERKHASAFEHCGTPMKSEQSVLRGAGLVVNIPAWPDSWEEGITHMDRQRNLWSGNLRGFIQYRKLIPGENYESY